MKIKNIVLNKKIITATCAILIAMLSGIFLLAKNVHKDDIYYLVTFDSNGGTNIEEQTLKKGETAIKPIDPIKENNLFIGWQLNNEIYDFSLPVESNLTLKAQWKEIEEDIEYLTVVFDSDGGSTIANQIIEKGDVILKPQDPLKDGYSFDYWSLNNQEFDFTSKVEENIVLVAKWVKTKSESSNNSGNSTSTPRPSNNTSQDSTSKPPIEPDHDSNIQKPIPSDPIKYTVTFNSNGGSNVEKQTIVEGNKAIKPDDPTREGYTFVYWTLNGKKYDFSNTINNNIILIAKWTSNIWEIDESTGTIIKYKGSASTVEISKNIDGITIKSIKSGAFSNQNLKELRISANVLNIESDAIAKSNNINLLKVYMSDAQYKAINVRKAFGMENYCARDTDKGTLIWSRLVRNGCVSCNGSCSITNLINIYNIVGVYAIYYDVGNCVTRGPVITDAGHYIPTEEYTIGNISAPAGYRFDGWTGSNGNIPQKDIVIPKGSTGDKRYEAHCSKIDGAS